MLRALKPDTNVLSLRRFRPREQQVCVKEALTKVGLCDSASTAIACRPCSCTVAQFLYEATFPILVAQQAVWLSRRCLTLDAGVSPSLDRVGSQIVTNVEIVVPQMAPEGDDAEVDRGTAPLPKEDAAWATTVLTQEFIAVLGQRIKLLRSKRCPGRHANENVDIRLGVEAGYGGAPKVLHVHGKARKDRPDLLGLPLVEGGPTRIIGHQFYVKFLNL